MKAKVCIGRLLLIAIALCLHFSGMTQGFNYQAVVRDATGATITNRNVKIRITLQNTQGTQFFSENKTLTTSAQGVINHVVGSGTITLGALTSVPWNSGDIKIKVDIDPNGGTNYTILGTPTLIQPVPFALYAASGTQGPAGQDGLSIDWLGNLFNEPNTPSKNQAYYNLNLKTAYIYNGSSWDILAKDGTDGTNGTNGIDGLPIIWLGDFDNPPAGSKNKAYYNNTDKKSYIHDGTGWVTMTVDGKDGKDGTNGTNGTNGLSIHWRGNLSSQPTGTLNDAYYNINDKKSYIFNGLSWDQLTQDGADGLDGTSIHWLGDLGAHPAAVLNNAYYNTTDKKSYIYDGANWVTLAKDGAKGDPGPGLINKGTWVANTPYISGNYVFHRSTASAVVNSMYICQVDVTSTTEPYLDGSHWVELQSIKGDKGDTGTPGTNGISIQWLANSSSYPSNPSVNQAFYHTGLKKSFIYNGSSWQTVATDGSNGVNGISITWLGPLGAYPGSPALNSAFYHTGDKKSYIWNGAGWNILAVDGTNGTNGTNGSNGTNGISIQWLGNLASAPQSPTLNQAYYHTGDKKSYIYNGSGWSILAQDGMPISGLSGQTLYYNGAWTPTSTITNDGTNVGIGINPTAKLDVNGGIRLRSALYDNTSASLNPGTTDQILTSTGTGILWKSPNGITGVTTGSGINGQLAIWSGTNSLNGVTNLSWGSSLQVASNTTAGPDDPIFEVKNKDGKVVFGVYQGGVRVYVEDSPTVKGARGGFAVGGLSQTKGVSNEYLKITPDSARIYIDNTNTKGARGGFAVGGRSQTKGTEEYLRITPDSARIYIDDTPTIKGARGGFAVGGRSQTKASPQEYLRITPDSARVYVNKNPNLKGARGGFAVGGLSQTKESKSNFFNIETGDKYVINPSEARILWYPLKHAFLTGDVLILDPNDVGQNSFSSGFESKAKGQYSQALGYKTYALGNYSTAIGNNAIARFDGSFAFGDGADAANTSSFAFGKSALASGSSSFALGELVSAGTTLNGNSYAFGRKSNATGKSAYAIGDSVYATNSYAYALGRRSIASGLGSYAFGMSSTAAGEASFAFGSNASTSSTAKNSFAFGQLAQANGEQSYSLGKSAVANGNFSYAFGEGSSTLSTANNSFAFGQNAVANGVSSYAFGNTAATSNVATNSFSFGKSAVANGISSYAFGDGASTGISASNGFAFGKSSQANGASSYAFGDGSTASGANSFALGRTAKAVANYSFAIGDNVTANNQYSYAFGKSSITSADYAIAMGNTATASGLSSFAVNGTASGQYSKAFGGTASGNYSLTSGESATASGTNSVAMGYQANASGDYSFALGYYVKATASKSLCFGMGQLNVPPTPATYSEANGVGSIALGSSVKAMLNGSIAIGAGNQSTGLAATALGFHTTAQAAYSTVVGSYNVISGNTLNWVLTEPLFVVGNGDPNTAVASNALTVLKNGNVGIGVISPAQKLDISGNANITGNMVVTSSITSPLILSGTTSTYAPLHVQKWQGTVAVFNRRNTDGDIVEFWRGDPDGNKVGSISVTSTATTYKTTSDSRLKDNIVNTRFGINDLMKVQVRDFIFKKDQSKKVNSGFIAQELFEIYPEAVSKPNEEEGIWEVDYGRITPLIVKAVQDQQKEIETYKQENNKLKSELETLKSELEAIKAMLKK